MYNISQFLDEKGRQVYSVRQDAPVYEALELMAEKDCGALVVLDEIISRDLCGHAVETGDYLRQEIEGWRHPAIRHVRGLGLMLGIVLDEAGRNGARLPVTALVDQFYAQIQDRGGNRWDTSSLIDLLTNP